MENDETSNTIRASTMKLDFHHQKFFINFLSLYMKDYLGRFKTLLYFYFFSRFDFHQLICYSLSMNHSNYFYFVSMVKNFSILHSTLLLIKEKHHIVISKWTPLLKYFESTHFNLCFQQILFIEIGHLIHTILSQYFMKTYLFNFRVPYLFNNTYFLKALNSIFIFSYRKLFIDNLYENFFYFQLVHFSLKISQISNLSIIYGKH